MGLDIGLSPHPINGVGYRVEPPRPSPNPIRPPEPLYGVTQPHLGSQNPVRPHNNSKHHWESPINGLDMGLPPLDSP